jgi:hypothetical protein
VAQMYQGRAGGKTMKRSKSWVWALLRIWGHCLITGPFSHRMMATRILSGPHDNTDGELARIECECGRVYYDSVADSREIPS